MAARLDDDPLLLAEPANFDPLYSAVRHFGALGTEARERTQEVIGEALKGATLVCKRTINAMGGSDDELAERRQLLRLAAFLQSWLVREAEKLAEESAANAVQVARLEDHEERIDLVPELLGMDVTGIAAGGR